MTEESTARLNIEFRSLNVARALKDADAVKQSVAGMFRDTYKSAKDSAAVFEEDQRKLHADWMRRLRERDQAEKVQQRQAGISARAEQDRIRANERRIEAEKRAAFKVGVATQLAQIRAASAEELAIKKANLQRELEAAKAVARAKALAEKQPGSGSAVGGRVALGVVAGQGFSIGGLASVNPYAAAAVAGAYAVKRATQDLVGEATKWEKFKVALTDIEGSAQKADVALNNLYQIAKQPGIGLMQAEQTYIQYRALNVEGAKAEKTIKAIANAVALSGGGATEFERVNYQIIQMLSKGKVLEEDLRIMRNSMPRLTVAMREAFGATTAEGIRNAGINAEQFLAGIVGQFEKLPKATQTLESAQENASTAMSQLKAALVPDAFVKSSIQGWTGLLENLTSAVNAVKSPVATASSAFEELKSTIRDAGATSIDDYSKAKAGERKYGIQAYKTLNNFGSEMEQATSRDAYLRDQAAKRDAELHRLAEIEKALAPITLENQKIAIQLSDANEYEKQRRTVVVEYAAKIKEAASEEEKIALTKQRGLQVALINKKQMEDERKTLDALSLQHDKLEIQVLNANEYEKRRLQIGVEYEAKMREATSNAVRASLAEQKRLELQILRTKVATDEAAAVEAINVETDKLLINNAQINEFARQRLLIENEYATRISTANSPEQKRALEVQKGIQLQGVDVKEQAAAEALVLKYLPETERLRIEYDKQREIISSMTSVSMEERNAILKRANEEYLLQQRELTLKSSEVFLTGASSLFDALSGTAEGVMGKQSEAYKVMFATSKAFAIANSSLQVANAIANAAGSLPFPANLAAMGQVAAATAGLVANINALSFSGVFDKGGYIPEGSFGIAGENGPEFVRGPAYVTSTANTAKALGKGDLKVVVNNFSSEPVATRMTPGGELEMIVGRAVEAAENRIISGIASGGGKVSKAIETTYSVKRR